MALVALDGTPLIMIGNLGAHTATWDGAVQGITIDAANEASICYGHIFNEDGGSHTIDTTGSSSLGWLTGAVTFANAGTTVKVGLAAMDAANGPVGRAANAANVITFDVARSIAGGGGGITASAWQEHVPTSGTKTIAHGDLVGFCVQMTARGGVDSVIANSRLSSNASHYPGVTSYTGGTYALASGVPNAVITYSDGTLGWFFGGCVLVSSNNTVSFNSGSSPNEYGNILQIPFSAKAHGICAKFAPATDGACDLVLYSDPLGTPVAEKTVSIDNDITGGVGAQSLFNVLFPAPFILKPKTNYAVIVKPTTANSATLGYKTLNALSHQKAEHCGVNCYAINRSSGAFAAQNSSKDRFSIGLIVGAFDNGVQPGYGMGM